MTASPPPLTDLAALARQRERACRLPCHDAAMFAHRLALADVQERLVEVNRTFTSPVVVTGFPDLWRDVARGALVTADQDALGLTAGAHDLIVHAMGLHWANDPLGQLVQCRRALRPDGLFIAVFPGGRTLNELRSALAEGESRAIGGLSPRVVPMGEIRELGGLMQRSGFAFPVADSVTQRVEYASFRALLADLRAMGETNALAARPRQFTRRSVLSEAEVIYRQTFTLPNGRLLATLDLVFLTGWAPHDSQQKPLRPGSAQQRLADALGAVEEPLPKGG